MSDPTIDTTTQPPILPVQNVKMSEIHFDQEFNCRDEIRPIDVADLARDIQAKGLLQPIVVTRYTPEMMMKTGKQYLIVAGYRRFMAHKMIKAETILCTIHPDMPHAAAVLLNFTENSQRQMLNIVEEARALKKLFDLGMTETKIVEALPGKSRGWVQVRGMLLKLPEEVQHECAIGNVGQTAIRQLYSILRSDFDSEEKKHDVIMEAVRKIKKAKAEGHTIDVAEKFKKKNCKKQRTRHEILEMMNYLYEQNMPPGVWSRCMAWDAGEITTEEFYSAIEDFMSLVGRIFVRPQENM